MVHGHIADIHPSNDDFSQYLDSLFNPGNVAQNLAFTPDQAKYIPILDEPIQPSEVDKAIKQLQQLEYTGWNQEF